MIREMTPDNLDRSARPPDITGMAPAKPSTIESPVVRLLSRREAEREDRVYWHTKTPQERLAAAEQLRQLAFGYDPATARIQAVVVRTVLKGG